MNPAASEEDVDAQVTWEDQQNINTFGKLNARLHELQDEVKSIKSEINKLDDANTELFMQTDNTELIKYQIGEAFVSVTQEGADKMLEAEKNRLEASISDNELQQKSIRVTLAQLKVKLYGKFGKSINLEED